MRERNGNLIKLAKEGFFDVITHGCNCFCTMGSGIAVPMKYNFACDLFPMEDSEYKGDINKLGTIDYEIQNIIVKKEINLGTGKVLAADFGGKDLVVINSYTQYHYGKNHKDGVEKPVDYDAITMCMRKINHLFKGKTIGLPKIGAGLAGGDWYKIKNIIKTELNAMDVWIVHYNE